MKTLSAFPLPPRSRLFDGFSRSESLEIIRILGATAKHYRAGENIITQGDAFGHYWLVSTGEVHSYGVHTDGKRTVTGSFTCGDTFGLLFAFSDMPHHPSTATAITDAIVIEFPIVDIINDTKLTSSKFCRRFLQNTVNVISQSAYWARFRAFVVSHKTVEGRLCAYLSQKAKLFGSQEFDISLDRQELADFLGSDRCSVSSAISRLKRSGKIEARKYHFKILASLDCSDGD